MGAGLARRAITTPASWATSWPSTYTYHTQSAWRRYFRGTAAHNTVRVDGEDQSQSGGTFMWLKKGAGCTLWTPAQDRDEFEGWHDGYMRLPDPVVHRRRITLEKRTRRLVIEDILLMAGAHDIELLFHCDEPCRIDSATGGYQISRDGSAIFLTLPSKEGASTRTYCGSTDPIRGWVSRRFGDKRPAATIVWQARPEGDAVLRSEIDCGEPAGRRAAEAGSSGTALSGNLD